MHQDFRHGLRATVAFSALLGAFAAAQAGGFALREQSAAGQGMSFAGVAAGVGRLILHVLEPGDDHHDARLEQRVERRRHPAVCLDHADAADRDTPGRIRKYRQPGRSSLRIFELPGQRTPLDRSVDGRAVRSFYQNARSLGRAGLRRVVESRQLQRQRHRRLQAQRLDFDRRRPFRAISFGPPARLRGFRSALADRTFSKATT